MTTARLTGQTLWITDQFSGTVSALNANRMAFQREALLAPRSARGVVQLGRDLWITSEDALSGGGRLRLERYDARSARRAGRAVPLGRASDYAMAFTRGSLWVLTASDLIRLTPTAPRSALDSPARKVRLPRAYVAGPLGAATWRAHVMGVPLTFKTSAFAWIAVIPLADSLTLLAAHERQAELDITAPRQVFVSDQGVRTVGTPQQLLAALRQNQHIHISPVRRVLIGGRRALQFEVRASHPVAHPEVCGPVPCTLLFPNQESTIAAAAGGVMRLSLLRSAGRTIVIAEGGDGGDLAALALTAAVTSTLQFPS